MLFKPHEFETDEKDIHKNDFNPYEIPWNRWW